MLDMFFGDESMRYEPFRAIANRHDDKLLDVVRSAEFSFPGLETRRRKSEQAKYRNIESLKQRGYTSDPKSTQLAGHLLAEPERVAIGNGSSHK